MKIGLQIPFFDWPGGLWSIGPGLVKVAKTAESAGFSSLWVMDHLFQLGDAFGPPDAPLLEAYSTLSYLAAVTKKIKVGVLVTNNICRHPGLLVKIVSTLDVLSGGRTCLGVGPGGAREREIKGMGIPLPPLKERVDRLEETLQIFKHVWSGNRSQYRGKYFQLEEPINSPQPLSKPHPPILVGMWQGGRRMLRLTAKYADACNLQFGSPLMEFPVWMRERFEEFEAFSRNKLATLKQNCERIGRAYESIERTALGTIKISPDAMNADDAVELCERYEKIGFQQVIFNMPNVQEIEPLRVIARDVIPEVAGT